MQKGVLSFKEKLWMIVQNELTEMRAGLLGKDSSESGI